MTASMEMSVGCCIYVEEALISGESLIGMFYSLTGKNSQIKVIVSPGCKSTEIRIISLTQIKCFRFLEQLGK